MRIGGRAANETNEEKDKRMLARLASMSRDSEGVLYLCEDILYNQGENTDTWSQTGSQYRC